MKIAFFSNSYLPYISGVTVCVSTLTKCLRSLGHEVYLFVPSYPGHEETDPYIYRIASIPSTYPDFRLTIPFIKSSRARQILKEVDIIHSHTPFGLGLLAMFFAKTHKKPYVYTFHTQFKRYLHHIPLLPKNLGEASLSIYLRLFCRGTRLVLAPSKVMKQYLRDEKIKTDIEVLPGGIDFSRSEKVSPLKVREKFHLTPSDALLMYCGRITKEKNLAFLFRAFQLIKKKATHVYLLLAGSGPDEAYLKNLALKLGIFENLIFAGSRSPVEVFDYYAAADLFVFASKTETQGLVVSEAKSVGVPVVAVDAGGVSESVVDGEDGFLVPEQEEVFAEKCLSIIRNPDLKQKMGDQARLNARSHFSAEGMAENLAQIYFALA